MTGKEELLASLEHFILITIISVELFGKKTLALVWFCFVDADMSSTMSGL